MLSLKLINQITLTDDTYAEIDLKVKHFNKDVFLYFLYKIHTLIFTCEFILISTP